MSTLRAALAALAVAIASPATAADLTRPYYGDAQAVQPSLLPGFVWTGLYAGGQVGYNGSKVDWDQTSAFNLNGFSGGVHVGYNWQISQFVYGLEGQLNWTNADGSKSCMTGYTCSADVNWGGDLRVRAGYAFDRAMLFGAAGVAYTSVKTRESQTQTSGDADLIGLTIGLGGEYAITQNVTAGVEYKYTTYGDDNVKPNITGVNLDSNVLQARLSYKF